LNELVSILRDKSSASGCYLPFPLAIARRFGAYIAFGPRLIAFDSTILTCVLVADPCTLKGTATLHVKQPFLDFGAEVLLVLSSGIE